MTVHILTYSPENAVPSLSVRRWVRRSALLLSLAIVTLWAVPLYVLGNHRVVVPGRIYRCAQPSGDDLRDLVRDKHVRTVVNLRGNSHGMPWYVEESRASHELNVSQEDVTLSANRLPAPAELRRLIDVLDHTEYPVVIHCKAGADRTGLASAAALLLFTDATLDEARRQLWPWYGHFRFGRTAAMDRFFDQYEQWLAARGADHSPDRFRHWALAEYSPGPARSELTWLDAPPNPVAADRPFAVRVRAVNRSAVPWEFQPGDYAGLHLSYVVATEGMVGVYRGKAGLRRETVPPGGETVFDVVVPAIKAPGRYVLSAELHDATGAGVPFRANSFVQFGDESLMTHVLVK